MTESFEVHLKSLLDFAAELEGQMTALGLPNDRLAVLTGAPMPLGDFTEVGDEAGDGGFVEAGRRGDVGTGAGRV
ncbi:hypothetical protein AB0M47_32850, partial [Hamadaea sp. NPDC051192]